MYHPLGCSIAQTFLKRKPLNIIIFNSSKIEKKISVSIISLFNSTFKDLGTHVKMLCD